MKRFLFAAALYVFAFVAPASAQSVDAAPAVPASLVEYYDQWTPKQWRALEKQLLNSLRVPVAQIDQSVLQNVIYFETHYPEAMNLDRAARRLMRIYQQHPEAPVRVMAISALHAVSEPETMKQLAQLIRKEESDMARHVGAAAVVDFYRSQESR